MFYDGAQSVQGLRRFRGLAQSLPDEIAPVAFTGAVPEAEGIPAEIVGKPMLAVAAVYVGPAREGEERLRPLRDLAAPLADLSGRMPYVEIQRFLDKDYPRGRRYTGSRRPSAS